MSADTILKCTGFTIDSSIFGGHDITDTIFIDGIPNMTHICGMDRIIQGTYFMCGPNAPINLIPVVSIPLTNTICDTLAVHFMKYKKRFKRFSNYNHF